MTEFRSYRSLKAWQIGMDVAEAAYRLTASFPKHEIFGLSGQLRRAAASIPANIAEGHARETTKDFLRFFLSLKALWLNWKHTCFWHNVFRI